MCCTFFICSLPPGNSLQVDESRCPACTLLAFAAFCFAFSAFSALRAAADLRFVVAGADFSFSWGDALAAAPCAGCAQSRTSCLGLIVSLLGRCKFVMVTKRPSPQESTSACCNLTTVKGRTGSPCHGRERAWQRSPAWQPQRPARGRARLGPPASSSLLLPSCQPRLQECRNV